MSDPVEAFAQNVKRLRLAAGLTQDDTAHGAQMDVGQWRNIENGQVNPTVRTLVRVAAGLGIADIGRLFEGIEPTPSPPKRRKQD